MRLVLLLGILVLFSGAAFALPLAQLTASYTVVEDTVLVEETLTFPPSLHSFSLPLPADAEALEIEGATGIQKGAMLFLTGDPLLQVTVKYITEALIEKTHDRFFIADFSRVAAEKMEIEVVLPEGATLKYPLDAPQTAIIPKTTKVTTNGKSLLLQWDEKDLQEGKALVIIYQEPQKTFSWLMVLMGLLVLGAGVRFFFHQRNIFSEKGQKEPPEEKKETGEITPEAEKRSSTEKSSSKEQLTRNLFEEERAIVEILVSAKDQELWQKQLVLETGISKVKLSRKLRNLEAKGIVERIPFGNTNKIRLKKRRE